MISFLMSFSLIIAAQAAPAGEQTCLAPQKVAQELGSRHFVQERHLKGIDQALVSSGAVLVASDSIMWTVSDPIEISTVISESGMTQSIEGGPAEPVGAAGAANPMLSQSGLVNLLKGDLRGVDENYIVSEIENETGWGLSLMPKAQDMAKHVTAINVTGCTKIDSIKVKQSNGDVIFVTFSKG